MTGPEITDEWLSACDFKWRQGDRQPNKHWVLKLNVADDECLEWVDVAIEVQRFGWEGRQGYIGDHESWMLWVTDTFGGTAFLGTIRYKQDIIGLAEIITRRQWDPKTHLYGQAWPENASVLQEGRTS